MTGKTSLVRNLPSAAFIDLLDPEQELRLRQTPSFFWEEIQTFSKNSLVVVDEIQKVPALLNYVQKGIEELGLRFVLTGSSARKLKRGGANLLGGRAHDLKLHPLTVREIGPRFDVSLALQYGTLPKFTTLALEKNMEEVKSLLRSYYTTYIKEEIQAEALTRNVGAFQRFLNVAAQANGQVIEFQNISRECSVPASTVKEYFTILEDTLIGEFLWPWDRSERKKARPKFFFFDCGVVRSIQNRLNDPPTSQEMGFLFETWFVRELIRFRDYFRKSHEFCFWREGSHEIDILIMGRGEPILAIECKAGNELLSETARQAFSARFPKVPLVIASLKDKTRRHLASGIEILPWRDALEMYERLS
ncbi:MAG: ATP-binding protein [Candidatus Omnitrophica bacterium]|nr:ATP-binding protein [Candidatus Omnitrophota bacterium]